MAWNLPEGEGFGAGFDQSGGETWQQAKTVDPSQKGVYEGYTSWNPFNFHPGGGGTRLTSEGKDVNRLTGDWNKFRTGKDSIFGNAADLLPSEQRHLFQQNYLRNMQEDYPGAWGLGMREDDFYKQQLLDEEASEDYKWLAGGGIASLENRPGYRWGGSPHLDLTKSQRGERLLADTMKANIQPYAGNMMDNWTFGGQGRDFRDTHHYTKRPASFNDLMGEWLSKEAYKEDEEIRGRGLSGAYEAYGGAGTGSTYEGGGAVGLEPGIGSLMGYAKGGMITKVRVPKGQSKWMRRFMNNMRDN